MHSMSASVCVCVLWGKKLLECSAKLSKSTWRLPQAGAASQGIIVGTLQSWEKERERERPVEMARNYVRQYT